MPRRSGLGAGFSTLIAGTILIVIGQVLLITTLSFLGNELRAHVPRPPFKGVSRSNYTKIILEHLGFVTVAASKRI